MEEGTFEKVESSEERMYGPKGIIVCGCKKIWISKA